MEGMEEGKVKIAKGRTWRLFAGFFRIGFFTIGGGYAMIPLIQHDIVEKRKWLEDEEFLDLIALAQSLPGVITINTAVIVGYKVNGLKGAVAAALGAGLPSFVIIVLVASYFLNFRDNIYVQRFFTGARAAVVGLVLYAAFSLGKTTLRTKKSWLCFIFGLSLLLVLDVHPAVVIIVSGLLGYFFFKEEGD